MSRWNRYTTESLNTFTFYGWVVLDADGSMKLSRTEPAVSRNQRKMKLDVTVPKSVFRTPELRAVISISDDDAPPVISAEVQARAAEALRDVIGVDIALSVSPPAGGEA